jgi:hypothetical protein
MRLRSPSSGLSTMPKDQSDASHEIAGAEALIQWFGEWPSFHDAEVLSLTLNRTGRSCVRIHTWEATREVDDKGFNVLRKHVQVSFFLDGLKDLELAGFSSQNVIFGLEIRRSEEGLQLVLDPCYGVSGSLTAEAISVEFEPGKPSDAGSA